MNNLLRDDVARRIQADRDFIAKQRPLSPVFPDIATALARRQRHQENLAARFLLFMLACGVVYSLWTGDAFGWLVAGFGFLGFALTVVVACTRQHGRNGGHDRA